MKNDFKNKGVIWVRPILSWVNFPDDWFLLTGHFVTDLMSDVHHMHCGGELQFTWKEGEVEGVFGGGGGVGEEEEREWKKG